MDAQLFDLYDLVMLNLFQHPPSRRDRLSCGAMDAEPKAGEAKQVQHDEGVKERSILRRR
ncbi:MAG: hypothetical protein CFE37_12260 [Alphaproteobacteria bacterium PA4]|nr:MAG: hypothetical protein CFE37_12260 [Alphaproteobacteria bacterium PA4]